VEFVVLPSSAVPRRPRNHLSNGIYHVTGQAVSGLMLFVDDEDRRAFLWLLESVATRFRLMCLAYCLMGTHYHLLLEGKRENLSLAMKQLNGRYARRSNERHTRRGHLFADRYSAYLVRDERHLQETLNYIAANPVIAGLCKSVDEWPWTWRAGFLAPTAGLPTGTW
jgi:putative transposase